MDGIAGIILAGGRSTRMGGGDKGLKLLAGRPIVAHVAARLAPQVAAAALNANGDPRRFAFLSLPVLPDTLPGFLGPLAGVLAGLEWAAGRGAAQAVTVAADTPFLPADLVSRLWAAAPEDGRIAVARCMGRAHPVFALWPAAAAQPLREFLASGQKASVLRFAESRPHVFADFAPFEAGGRTVDPFFNINTPADLEAAERIAADKGP